MRLPLVEQMVKTGSIRQDARDTIQHEYKTYLEKVSMHPLAQSAMRTIDVLIPRGIEYGLSSLYTNHLNNKAVNNDVQSIIRVRKEVSEDPAFQGNQDKALKYFDDIVKVAPSVALNKPLMVSMITKAIKTGLTHDDVLKLSMLQASLLNNNELQGRRVNSFQQALQKQAASESLGDLYAEVYLMGKTASLSLTPETSQRLMDALKTTAIMSAVPLIAGAGNAIVHAFSAHKSEKEMKSALENSYNQAFAYSKEDVIHQHPDKARRAFESLVHFAPHVALDPNATRVFLNHIVPYEEGFNTSKIKELTDIERNLSQGGPQKTVSSEFLRGADALGLKNMMTGTLLSAAKPTQETIGNIINVAHKPKSSEEDESNGADNK